MREYVRIKRILNKLEEVWNKHPEQRFGQLLENHIFSNGKRGDVTSIKLFYQEDEETEYLLDKQL